MCVRDTRRHQNVGEKLVATEITVVYFWRENNEILFPNRTALVSLFRRKSTTYNQYANCDIDFQLQGAHIQSKIELILSVIFWSLFFLISLSPSPMPLTRNITKKITWKWGKTQARKYLEYLQSFLPVAVFPYGLSLVHMLSLLTTARLTKELLGKL